jgi:hypothetical protein
MQIPVPDNFNDPSAIAFARLLPHHLQEAEVQFDFRPVRFVCPYGALVIANAIKHFSTSRRASGLKTSVQLGEKLTTGAISYLRYFGFFRYINVAGEMNKESAPGGARYLPVKILNLESLRPVKGTGQFQDTIETTSDSLARVIFPKTADQSAIDMLSYCFRELIRNSFEHAQVATCAVMAQRWENGIAEVAIADRGIGVYRALSQTHKIETPDEAVLRCLQPGISSGAQKQTGSQWDNTGFGLYVVSQLGKRYGSFSMLSAERFINPAQDISPLQQVPLPGTLVKLRVRTQDPEYWPDVLREIVCEGEAEAQKIPGAIATASAASKKSNTWNGTKSP